MLKNNLLKNTTNTLLKSNNKSFSFLLHEYQGQNLLKKYDVATPKVKKKKKNYK